jgi:hypothetical protein
MTTDPSEYEDDYYYYYYYYYYYNNICSLYNDAFSVILTI